MWPAMPEGKLERAKWHVEFGSRHIARQCEIIEQMRQIGISH